MNVLVLVPNLKNVGGVSSLFNALKINRYSGIKYFEVQGKLKTLSVLRVFEMLYLYLKFLLIMHQYEVIHVNPSLNRNSFFRDGLYLFLSRLFGKRVLVYWHGWEQPFEQKVREQLFLKRYFRYSFFKADLHVVLGTVFKESLFQLGISKEKITIESNAADNSYLTAQLPLVSDVYRKKKVIQLLFLARIEEEKGVFVAIDTLKLLNSEGGFHLSIAGEGSALGMAKSKIKEGAVENVTFWGTVRGARKHKLLEASDILLFPTSFPEGMPICILEAMMYGLAIVSRPVGGIPDWVKDGENGYLLESKESEDFAGIIETLTRNEEKFEAIRKRNMKLARDYFTPEALNKRLMDYYRQTMKKEV